MKHKDAFTLVEIVIAMAVTTFCVIILLGLLPVALNTAQSSRRDTRAAYLAEQVVSDLRSSPFTNATIFYTNSATSTFGVLTSFGMNTNATCVLACDGSDNVVALSTPTAYTNGLAGSANYLVQVTVTNTIPNLASVSVEVSAPAQAALTSRTRFGFQTMIGNRQ